MYKQRTIFSAVWCCCRCHRRRRRCFFLFLFFYEQFHLRNIRCYCMYFVPFALWLSTQHIAQLGCVHVYVWCSSMKASKRNVLVCSAHTHTRTHTKAFMFLYWMMESERAPKINVCARNAILCTCISWWLCVCALANERETERAMFVSVGSRDSMPVAWPHANTYATHIFCVVCHLPLSIAAWKSMWACVLVYAAKSMDKFICCWT